MIDMARIPRVLLTLSIAWRLKSHKVLRVHIRIFQLLRAGLLSPSHAVFVAFFHPSHFFFFFNKNFHTFTPPVDLFELIISSLHWFIYAFFMLRISFKIWFIFSSHLSCTLFRKTLWWSKNSLFMRRIAKSMAGPHLSRFHGIESKLSLSSWILQSFFNKKKLSLGEF